jgi:CBS domain-containing protein
MSTPASSLSDHIQAHRIFGLLSEQGQQRLAEALTLHRLDAGATLDLAGDPSPALQWLVSGELFLLDDQRQPILALRAGELLAPTAHPGIASARAQTPCELARLDASLADSLREESAALTILLPPAPTVSDSKARERNQADPALNLMTAPVRSLIKREPVTLPPHTPIHEAARVMSEKRVSSVLLVEQDHLFGLITDRDLRNRVLATGLDAARPVADIATLAPLTIDVQNPAFDALLLMARHNIHHVPVLDRQRIVGMITATDVTEQHSTSAVYLAGEVYKQTTVDGLKAASGRIKRLQQSLASAQASAYSSGHIITAITDAITSRLLQLAEIQLGPAPVDYVWVAAGSQARNEQTAKSDQDNCMVLDNRYDEAQHGAYFKAMAQFVCDGLDACGYIYCPGEMMAMTDTWRQPQHRWAGYFARWTSVPEPKALMLTCVFFDLRAIHGNSSLLDDLRRDVLARTKGNTLFLAHMVGNALQHQPPLGVFKGISAIRSGEHKGKVDLKHTGVVPIVDLARVYALAGGHEAVNTHDRLVSAAAGGAISEQSARDLRDALEFLAFTRIQHQARQIAAGQPPDNFLPLTDISNFERSQLKDAFTVVQSLQNVIGQRYRM